MRWPVLALLVGVLALPGCTGRDCTLIGVVEGVGVTIPAELWLPEGEVAVTVCDAEACASATEHLFLLRGRAGRRPGPREPTATFEDLGRVFDDGPVQVAVELRDAGGTLVARREQDVDLVRVWPNGRACDGDGFVHGTIALRASDGVGAPA